MKTTAPIAHAFSLASLMLLLLATGARSQCDIPLVSQQVSTPPNVMIAMDSSGSMTEPMLHPDFDSSTAWSGRFGLTSTYAVGATDLYAPDQFFTDGETSPKVRLATGLHGRAARYSGNYLNWLYYHATDEQRTDAPALTRQEVQNAAVKYIMNQSGNLRFGITKFNGENGGTVVAPCGSSSAVLEAAVDNMVADGYTPLAETLWTVYRYFRGEIGTSPIDYECQQSFVIMITDGLPTRDTSLPSHFSDVAGNGYLDDVARYVARQDLSSAHAGDQNLVVFTIGLGIGDQLLVNTAAEGNGMFREAWDLDTLTLELGTVIGDIVNRISAGAAVAVVSTETGDDSYLYRGKFVPTLWRGFLEAFELPFSEGDSPIWEAGALLRGRDPDTRVLFTSLNNQMVEFSASSLDELGPLIAPNGPGSGDDRYDGFGDDVQDNVFDAADQNLGPAYDADYARDVVEYVRGKAISGFRDREGWILGDLVYSTPVVVGAPSQFFMTQSYQDFLGNHENRQPMVYVGANDGMLHAFKAGSGHELWSYVPRDVLGTLEALTEDPYCRRSYVDLSPTAADVEISGNWRTILVGGLRTGGNAYFAIDVTDPFDPKVLWETRIPTIVNSFTDPVVVRTTRGSFVWTGSGPSNSGHAYSGVIDIATGAIHWNLLLSSVAGGGRNATTGPSAIDLNGDGYHDRVYQADLAGNVWVYDVSDASGWYYGKLFDGDLPIQARPSLSVNENGGVNVYFGSGAFLDNTDMNDVTQNVFHCVRDDFSWNVATLADLASVGNTFVDTSNMNGWQFPLENGAGERVIEPSIAVEGVVYFSSFVPEHAPCSGGGRSYLYSIDFEAGTPIDRDEDDDLDDEDRSQHLGTGIASRPVVNLAREEIIVQTSDARLNVIDMASRPQRILVRAWRERFDNAAVQPVPPDPED